MEIVTSPNDQKSIEVPCMPQTVDEAYALSQKARSAGAIGPEDGQDTHLYVRQLGAGKSSITTLRELLRSVARRSGHR